MEEKQSKQEKDEFYLSVKLAGHETLAAFKNLDREGNQPHYKGHGISIWVNKKKPKQDFESAILEEEEVEL